MASIIIIVSLVNERDDMAILVESSCGLRVNTIMLPSVSKRLLCFEGNKGRNAASPKSRKMVQWRTQLAGIIGT